MPAVETDELSSAGWADVREDMARRFFGLHADDFVAKFKAGELDPDAPGLLAVLSVPRTRLSTPCPAGTVLKLGAGSWNQWSGRSAPSIFGFV
jgi:hypothetical protein